ncbi:hypothetical protein VTN00DRAFT_9788 [Thermoascus crustaceus]|uniref:uncharacterized protein n=1 Tax=Thermoascus crustaceus TaxID=5088 RepID=UPI00374343A7
MVIDLTLDSDSEEQASFTQQRQTEELLSLFTNRSSSVPRKRKSEISSAESSVASSECSNTRPLKNERNQTPSVASEHRAFSVVIPASPTPSTSERGSDSPRGKKPRRSFLSDSKPQFNGKKLDEAKPSNASPGGNRTAELTGLSTTFYPTDAHEIRASRGAYPKAKQVDREDVPLNLGRSGLHLAKKLHKRSLSMCRRLPEILQKKLSTIKGPPVTLVLGHDGSRAPFTTNFEFINSYKIQEGVRKVDESFNSGCSCGRICDPRKGFGLRSPDLIRAGQFIDCYLGEVITRETADKREEASKNGLSYLFSLDFLVDDEDIYVVDGQKMGSPTRFMNHSCNPNCKMFPVSRHHGDERLYDLAFFSLREIPPMTELTFDYNPGWEPRKIEPNAVKCLCGERNCRGQLWPNQRKTSGARKDED